MLEKCFFLFAIILRIKISDALAFDPTKLSRRELLTVPIAAGGAVFYGKLLSDATKKLTRGDLVYPDSHERRVKSTISEAILASIPQAQSNINKDATNDGIGRPLRILEVGIGKDCRVIRRGLYNDAFAGVSSRGVTDIDLIGLDIVSPTTGALERAKDVLLQKVENDRADVSFEFVKGSLTSRLDFRDGYFDCVICTLTLCSVDDQIAALNEIKRVLRKDGGSFGYIEHVAVNPDEPYRLLEFQQLAFDGWQQIVADNCHLHRFTEDNIYSVFGVSDGTSRIISKERFLVDEMWPVSCQTSGVIKLA
jgi:ubiquinone/menaquinone biosynthesis C-methylase UbiE